MQGGVVGEGTGASSHTCSLTGAPLLEHQQQPHRPWAEGSTLNSRQGQGEKGRASHPQDWAQGRARGLGPGGPHCLHLLTVPPIPGGWPGCLRPCLSSGLRRWPPRDAVLGPGGVQLPFLLRGPSELRWPGSRLSGWAGQELSMHQSALLRPGGLTGRVAGRPAEGPMLLRSCGAAPGVSGARSQVRKEPAQPTSMPRCPGFLAAWVS